MIRLYQGWGWVDGRNITPTLFGIEFLPPLRCSVFYHRISYKGQEPLSKCSYIVGIVEMLLDTVLTVEVKQISGGRFITIPEVTLKEPLLCGFISVNRCLLEVSLGIIARSEVGDISGE